jgi:hypothetical protein
MKTSYRVFAPIRVFPSLSVVRKIEAIKMESIYHIISIYKQINNYSRFLLEIKPCSKMFALGKVIHVQWRIMPSTNNLVCTLLLVDSLSITRQVILPKIRFYDIKLISDHL